jgi:hypothetical protein
MPLFNDPEFKNSQGEVSPLVLEDYQYNFVLSEERFPAMIAAWATGKTMCALYKAYILSMKYPDNLGLVLRKSYKDLSASTMLDFEKYTGLKIKNKSQNPSVTFDNGSKIMFAHIDNLSGMTQNVNLGWFFIEQAEELESDEIFHELRGRLRRAGTSRQGFIIANANGHNWCWRNWKQATNKKYHLIEATTFDNLRVMNEAAPDFIEDLREMEEERPSYYRRWVMNSHEDSDTADKVIPYKFISSAIGRDLIKRDNEATVISCDPAEFGNDKTVIMAIKGLTVIDIEVTEKKELMDTAGRVVRMYRKHNADKIAIDDIGVGAGVRSRLRELVMEGEISAPIMGINTGKAAEHSDKYVRLRDEIWMHAGELFAEGYVSIPDETVLTEELGAMSYEVNSRGQVQVARKKDIKKILGRSTDYADALVMGLWAAKKTKKRERMFAGVTNDSSEYDIMKWGL